MQESAADEAFWQSRWQHNQIGFHQLAANPWLIRYFHVLGLQPGARVFVPLCGKTLDIAWLRGQGCEVVGVELSSLAVDQLFAEQGISPQISQLGALQRYETDALTVFTGNLFELRRENLGAIDAIYDRGALIALPKSMRDDYTAHLVHLTNAAPQLLVSYEYDQTQVPGPPFSVPAEEVRHHYGRTYRLHCLETHHVPGGRKGICPAQERVWHLGSA